MGFLLVFVSLAISLFPSAAQAPHEFFQAALSEILEEPEAIIMFGGDMMFDRSIRVALENEGDDFVFSCMGESLLEADVVVANLEGPITTHESMSVGSVVDTPENMRFTFPTTTAGLLARHNIWIVNLGNNHMLNFGREGVMQTKRWLNEAGVGFFGDPNAHTEEDRTLRTNINEVPFSFINWSDWTGGNKAEVLAQIQAEAASGRVTIVYTHWGDEYVAPPQRVRDLAHSFIDAGAEIVIGTHPHVVLEHEEYAGKHIYYSLGNFIFDQYWNDEVRTGLLLKIAFSKDGVEFVEEIKTRLERDRRTCLIEGNSAL